MDHWRTLTLWKWLSIGSRLKHSCFPYFVTSSSKHELHSNGMKDLMPQVNAWANVIFSVCSHPGDTPSTKSRQGGTPRPRFNEGTPPEKSQQLEGHPPAKSHQGATCQPSTNGGYPRPSPSGGSPQPSPDKRVPQPGMGYPLQGGGTPAQGWGTLHPGTGVPPSGWDSLWST